MRKKMWLLDIPLVGPSRVWLLQITKNISEIVFLASYPIRDVSSQQVLMITAEFDLVLDKTKVEESKNYLGQSVQFYEIVGGNHAQFGWYGNQKKMAMRQFQRRLNRIWWLKPSLIL